MASTNSSFSSSVHVLKDRLVDVTRGLRGKVSKPESEAGDDGGGGDGRGGTRTHHRSEALKNAFNRLRRPRRTRASTSATLVGPSGSNSRGPLGGTAIEMDKIKEDTERHEV